MIGNREKCSIKHMLPTSWNLKMFRSFLPAHRGPRRQLAEVLHELVSQVVLLEASDHANSDRVEDSEARDG